MFFGMIMFLERLVLGLTWRDVYLMMFLVKFTKNIKVFVFTPLGKDQGLLVLECVFPPLGKDEGLLVLESFFLH